MIHHDFSCTNLTCALTPGPRLARWETSLPFVACQYLKGQHEQNGRKWGGTIIALM